MVVDKKNRKDCRLYTSTTLGKENDGFLLLFEPLNLIREASPPFSGSFL